MSKLFTAINTISSNGLSFTDKDVISNATFRSLVEVLKLCTGCVTIRSADNKYATFDTSNVKILNYNLLEVVLISICFGKNTIKNSIDSTASSEIPKDTCIRRSRKRELTCDSDLETILHPLKRSLYTNSVSLIN